jgi:hypothetical protein
VEACAEDPAARLAALRRVLYLTELCFLRGWACDGGL